MKKRLFLFHGPDPKTNGGYHVLIEAFSYGKAFERFKKHLREQGRRDLLRSLITRMSWREIKPEDHEDGIVHSNIEAR